MANYEEKKNALRTGFEPVREDRNGFQVHLLNHSDTAATQVFTLLSILLLFTCKFI